MASLVEPPSITTVSVSAEVRFLRRLGDLDFGAVGGWTPFSSRVITCVSTLLRSKYLIRLLFVSAMYSLPERYKKRRKKGKPLVV